MIGTRFPISDLRFPRGASRRGIIAPPPMDLDASRVSGWIDSLVRQGSEIADVFVETRREIALDWRDGEIASARPACEQGLAARWQGRGQETLAFVSRVDEAGAREAVRALQSALGRAPLPIKPGRDEPPPESAAPADADRWIRRLSSLLSRHAPRHRLRWTMTDFARQVIPARGTAAAFTRRLISLEGTFLARSRRGDEIREFSFHAPDLESTGDELRAALSVAAEPRDPTVPCPDGENDVVLSGGCAAVLFHEILSHPLEFGAESPLSELEQARVAVPELEVRDDATRLDLFGGYERDDEGIKPRPVKLLDSGRLAGRLTDRSRAGAAGSNGHARRASPSEPPFVRGSNVIVSPGHTTTDEVARRLANGLWIERFQGGSVELVSGRFRLRFPRARRVRRGRLADELGPGTLAGDILGTLKSIEPGLGHDVRVDRSLGWCSRGGHVVPVQGAAPDILIRRASLRAAR
jgi:TldD protein